MAAAAPATTIFTLLSSRPSGKMPENCRNMSKDEQSIYSKVDQSRSWMDHEWKMDIIDIVDTMENGVGSAAKELDSQLSQLSSQM